MWEVMGAGVVVGPKHVKVLAGKTYHLSPRAWIRLYLPFKLDEICGSVTIATSLARDGVISGPIVTVAGLLQLSVYNSTPKVIRIAPTTPLLVIRGFSSVRVVRTQPIGAVKLGEVEESEITSELLNREVLEHYEEVCDLTRHPVLPAMKKLMVRADEVEWQVPKTSGQRTPFKTEEMACRRKVEEQIEAYIQRGYIRRVSCGEKAFLSPLLPLAKTDGSYRFTTDFRALNAHFVRKGQSQIDVWRRLWSLEPSWRYFAKLDLKDGFFGVPVDNVLQRLFAFSWQDKRFCWLRLPQGWTWSSILFAERIAEIFDGVGGVVQFADDLLIGAETKVMLRQRLHSVFSRLVTFGLKVNVQKATLLTKQLTFLGVEIANGHWSLCRYLTQKKESLGEIRSWKAIERLIGIVSYARKTIPETERLLSIARGFLKETKHKAHSSEQWEVISTQLNFMLSEAITRQRILVLPGLKTQSFLLESDWSDNYCGYMLYANSCNQLFLCDLGSKKMCERTSSFLGEFAALVWACKATKAYRGDLPLVIRSDNHAVVSVLNGSMPSGSDRRVLRLFGWLVSNECFLVEYVPGKANIGADLLSRPVLDVQKAKQNLDVAVNELTAEQRGRISQAHSGHFGWWKTYCKLKRQGQPLWKGAMSDVKTFVKECGHCVRHGNILKRQVYSPWISIAPNDTVFADIMGPLTWGTAHRKIWIVVLIDGFSRYVKLRVCNSPSGKAVVAAVEQWICSFGAPRFLFMDRGTAFTGGEVESVCALQSIERVWSPVRAPWSNGIAERAIQTILNRIRRLGPREVWNVLVEKVEREYNSMIHSGVGATPHEVFLGETATGEVLSQEVWSRVIRKAKDTTARAREQRRKQFEKAPRNQDRIDVGDQVFYYVPRKNKLEACWKGPATVVEAVGRRLFRVKENDQEIGPFHSWHLRH